MIYGKRSVGPQGRNQIERSKNHLTDLITLFYKRVRLKHHSYIIRLAKHYGLQMLILVLTEVSKQR